MGVRIWKRGYGSEDMGERIWERGYGREDIGERIWEKIGERIGDKRDCVLKSCL
jgi:hypothetical protein